MLSQFLFYPMEDFKPLPDLSAEEQRVLGSLIEKSRNHNEIISPDDLE